MLSSGLVVFAAELVTPVVEEDLHNGWFHQIDDRNIIINDVSLALASSLIYYNQEWKVVSSINLIGGDTILYRINEAGAVDLIKKGSGVPTDLAQDTEAQVPTQVEQVEQNVKLINEIKKVDGTWSN